MGEISASVEKTGGAGEAMTAASLVVLDDGKNLGKKKAVYEAAVRHVRKWGE